MIINGIRTLQEQKAQEQKELASLEKEFNEAITHVPQLYVLQQRILNRRKAVGHIDAAIRADETETDTET